jgi:DMSO/TMAO reductase YedYZ molybdopterin-dependent catalytic subunit
MTTRGFSGRRPSDDIALRLPPGQYETKDFPVLAKGPTPHVDLARWRFTVNDGPKPLASWSWQEFEALPQTTWRRDIHCVTKWSKLIRPWGVTIDDGVASRRHHAAERLSAGVIVRRLRPPIFPSRIYINAR